jgi:hypothetical protein
MTDTTVETATRIPLAPLASSVKRVARYACDIAIGELREGVPDCCGDTETGRTRESGKNYGHSEICDELISDSRQPQAFPAVLFNPGSHPL